MAAKHVLAIAMRLLGLSLCLRSASATLCDVAGNRLDCGRIGMSQQECESQNCCWVPAQFPGAPHVDLPWCFHPNAEPSEYHVVDMRRSGGSTHARLELSRSVQPGLGADIQNLSLEAEQLSDSVLRLKISDAAKPRWEVPRWLLDSQLLPCGSDGKSRQLADGEAKELQLELSVKREPFSLEVTRRGQASSTLFNSTATRLVFKDQYLELSTWLSPTATLYGAGERASHTLHLQRNGMPRTLYNRDLGPTFPEQNGYGSHPFVLALEPDGSAWGLLLLNSNAMDVVPSADKLSWRVTGGILDLMVLAGPSPLAVLDQLTAVVGRPAMMPHWSLGWHQSKYGYRSVWEVEDVVSSYREAELPLEAIWTDIDHLDGWRDFTFNPVHFPLPEMQRFVAELHRNGQHWMPIVDPGIKVDPGYPAYDQGLKQDAFMRGVDGQPYMGWVWPGASHYPDFLSPAGRQYFAGQLRQHHALVPWDGIWIDMNEASNFCTGDVCALRPLNSHPGREGASSVREDPPWVCQLDCQEAQGLNETQRSWLHPPYDVSSDLKRLPLGTKAMSVLATHHDGSVQYNTHQLYGISSAFTVAEAVGQVLGKRPFVLSRSSFLGSGAYAAHWTGDNSATWEQLRWSVPGVLGIGLWGIPMAGADICGFMGDTTPELCARWVSLGALGYPFARSHSDLHGGYQELYRWPEVAAAGKKALGMRYRLLPTLYSALHAAHLTGAPVMRPLFLNFPSDSNTHAIDRQFMVGEALLVSPVLDQGATAVDAYFPPGTWHSLWDDGGVVRAGAGGRTVRLDAQLGDIPLHMRGGTALAMQQGGLLTTRETKRSPLTVVVALPGVLSGQGPANTLAGQHLGAASETRITAQLYNDGGEEPEAGESLCNFLSIQAATRAHLASGGHEGEVLLQFGSPRQLRGSNGSACGLVSDVETAAAAGDSIEWPELGGVEVFGWHLPVEAVTLEVVQRMDTCGQLAVLERLEAPENVVGAGASGLKLNLAALGHKLECPYGLRVAWKTAELLAAS